MIYLLTPNCHSDDRREEESRLHPLYIYEILHFVQNDTTKKRRSICFSFWVAEAWLEQTTFGLWAQRATNCSTPRCLLFGGRWRIRTADPLLVRQMLWTSWAKRPKRGKSFQNFGGRWRIRTADPLLVRQMLWTSWAKRPKSFSSRDRLNLVGVDGFEPPTLCL